jgi:hypothetical protein
MKNAKAFTVVVFTALILASLQIVASGQTPGQKLANISARGSSVRWDVTSQHAGVTVTVSAPDGQVFRKEFPAGSSPEFTLFDKEGNRLADGQYTYEIRLTPILGAGVKEELAASRGRGDDAKVERDMRKRGILPAQPLVESGSFTIQNGSVIVAGAAEEPQATRKTIGQQRTPIVPSGNTVTRLRNHRFSLLAIPDQVIPDDLIVQGSACIGLDCVNNESFGFDTIRLKENNTRIKFDDTSTGTGFPNHDWQLTANDSASGGANKFSIEDITAATVPFTVTGSAPSNAIFVDSTGRVGFRTSTPVLDLHVATSNTPAMRLEQNNSGGFTAQTWDIAGNEANFFVRDVTGGSRLPFRIRPGAPTSSIDINASGNVGIGTASPSKKLSVTTSVAGDGILLTSSAAGSGAAVDLTSTDTGGVTWRSQSLGNVGGRVGNFSIVQVGNNTAIEIQKTTLNVGIGTTAPDQKLSVNGDASKTGSNTWLSFSDERLKNIKGNFNSGLKAVMQLQPIRFEYKRDNALGLKSEGEHIGFGAQALQKIIPEAVTKNSAGYLMVNGDPILWTMLNAIKEQQKEIADLKAEVQKLRAASHRRRK